VPRLQELTTDALVRGECGEALGQRGCR
jgi:hypothetical protein